MVADGGNLYIYILILVSELMYSPLYRRERRGGEGEVVAEGGGLRTVAAPHLCVGASEVIHVHVLILVLTYTHIHTLTLSYTCSCTYTYVLILVYLHFILIHVRALIRVYLHISVYRYTHHHTCALVLTRIGRMRRRSCILTIILVHYTHLISSLILKLTLTLTLIGTT